MRLDQSFAMAVNMLIHSRLRSYLTILGIIIGVAAVVAIVSIGAGAQLSVQQRLSGLGANIITVSPGFQRAGSGFRGFGGGGGESGVQNTKNLTNIDVQNIRTVNGVTFVDGIISGRASLDYLAQTASLNIEGVDPLAWTNMETTALATGRYLNPSDSNVVVLGNSIAQNTFKTPIGVNTLVTIGDSSFKVVGVLSSSGGFGGDDNRIFMPITQAQNILNKSVNNFDSIIFSVQDPATVSDITNITEQKLLISRHVTERTKDFSITSAAQTQASIESITSTFTLFLAAIAAVSLVVGAVGVANAMFTSVLEKTQEIGIMKAIGAKNSDILTIFVINSALLGIIGGLIGIGIGSGISVALPNIIGRIPGFTGAGGVQTVIPVSLLIEAILGSALIGMIAGVIPAYRASKLNVVDALRYE